MRKIESGQFHYRIKDKIKQISINTIEKIVDITLIDLLEGHRLHLIIEDVDNLNNHKFISTSFKGIKFDSKDLNNIIDKYIFNGTYANISYGFENTIDYLKINRDTVTTKGKKELEIVFRDMISTALIFYINDFLLPTEGYYRTTGDNIAIILYAYMTFYGLTDILHSNSNNLLHYINNTLKSNNQKNSYLYIKNQNQFINIKEITNDLKDKIYINYDFLTNNNTKFIYPIKNFNHTRFEDKTLFNILFTNEENFYAIKTNNNSDLEFFHKTTGYLCNNSVFYFQRPICIPSLKKYKSLCIPFETENPIFDKFKIGYFQSISNNFNQGGFIPILFTTAFTLTPNELYEYVEEYIKLLSNIMDINKENMSINIKKDVLNLRKNMVTLEKRKLKELVKKDPTYKKFLDKCNENELLFKNEN